MAHEDLALEYKLLAGAHHGLLLLASIFRDSLIPGPDFGTRLKISCDSQVTNWARTDLIGIPAFQNETSSGPRNLAHVARPLLACVWSGAKTSSLARLNSLLHFDSLGLLFVLLNAWKI